MVYGVDVSTDSGVELAPEVGYAYLTITVTDPGSARRLDLWGSPRLFQFGWFALGTTVPASTSSDGTVPYYNPPVWIDMDRMFLPAPQPGPETPDAFWCGRLFVGLVSGGSCRIEFWNYT